MKPPAEERDLAELAHDLRNALNGVALRLALALDRGILEERRLANLEAMHPHMRRARELVAELSARAVASRSHPAPATRSVS
jgi:hypothetical protein